MSRAHHLWALHRCLILFSTSFSVCRRSACHYARHGAPLIEVAIVAAPLPPAGDFNKPLPREWEGAFDVVWSSEVLCHAGDKQEIVAQIARVLKPGGVLCFTDIMGADDADEAQLRTFTDRNATTKLGRPSAYVRHFASAGLRYVSWWDNSHHLVRQFRTQLQSIDEFEGELKAAGLSDSFLNNWRESLTERVKVQSQHRVFAWGVFVARKPTAEELAAVAAGAAEANGH